MSALLATDLTGRHIGTAIAVEVAGRLIVGNLQRVEHKAAWGSGGGLGRTFLALDVDGLRWSGHVDPQADVSADHLAATQ